MIAEALVSVEAWAPIVALRNSVLAYPIVNAAHVLGVALLVGSIVPLDLRLAGLWRSIAIEPLWRVLSRTAGAGFVLALMTGLLLFATRATEYVESTLFLGKLGLIVVAGLNAIWVSRRLGSTPGRIPPPVRRGAVASIVLWLGVLLLGRLVGYF
ncbi:DUF2214 domain-containing protein [Aquisalimonas sp.]|uniref:DUF2214 domain-containing protein n=1 Tax=Aquisalimonas sp. TaxID=1872621 RepID=UPI0025B8F210|nr:DUF2214 domain-containing protein [Aquisalimonas sp.]